jgi:iron complex outermembrane receptor protein
MKGFIILGLGASSVLSAQTDSTQIKEIQEVSFTRRLPVSKEIINVQKDLGAKIWVKICRFCLKIKCL